MYSKDGSYRDKLLMRIVMLKRGEPKSSRSAVYADVSKLTGLVGQWEEATHYLQPCHKDNWC